MLGHNLRNASYRVDLLGRESRNRRLTDVVAARYAALCLTFCEPLPRLLLLMWGEGRLAPEVDAFGSRIGPAARGAFEDAATFELRRDAKQGKDKLGKIRRGIDSRFRKRRRGHRRQGRKGSARVAEGKCQGGQGAVS